MYKYKVQYRVYLSTSKPGDNHPHLSGKKDLEFKLNERLVKDGPGRWKNTVINIIKQNNPSVTYVYDDMTVKDLGYEQKSESNSKNISKNDNSNRESAEDRFRAREWDKIEKENEARQRLKEQQLRDEKDAKERAERKARANELRSQGKNFQAFLVEFQNGVIAGSILIGFALFFFFFNLYKEGNKTDAMKINSELEQIEDSVKIYINKKNYDKALMLVNKLVHSSHEDMEHLDFDAWSGYPKFDEYWTKKREEYKKLIFDKNKTPEEAKLENEIDKSPIQVEETQEVIPEEDTYIPTEPDVEEGLDPEYQEN